MLRDLILNYRSIVLKKLLLTLALLIFSISLNAENIKEFQGLQGSLNIAGGTAHIKCEKEAIKNIMRDNANVSISIAGGGSGIGIKQVSSHIIDLANSGRKPTANEIKKGDLKLFRFAIDGIGIVVNKNNSLSNLSTKQLQDIFAGKIVNFSELGLHNAKINLYTRDESSATRKVFWKKALKKSPIINSARVVSSNAAMKTAISNDKNAIGIISLGLVDDSIKLLNLDGVKASVKTINNSSYKVARGLFLLSSGEPKPMAKAFIDYMRSSDGANIVKKYGFIAVNE